MTKADKVERQQRPVVTDWDEAEAPVVEPKAQNETVGCLLHTGQSSNHLTEVTDSSRAATPGRNTQAGSRWSRRKSSERRFEIDAEFGTIPINTRTIDRQNYTKSKTQDMECRTQNAECDEFEIQSTL